jgi:hypothetical protein
MEVEVPGVHLVTITRLTVVKRKSKPSEQKGKNKQRQRKINGRLNNIIIFSLYITPLDI